MPARYLAPFAAFAVVACSSPAAVAERTGQSPRAKASATATAAASASTVKGKEVKEDTDLYTYELTYPASVARIPALKKQIEEGAAKNRSAMIEQARSAQAESKANDFPYNPHSLSELWQVVADVPGYLSLSNFFSTYSGGAHGMYGMDGLVWDKKKGRGFRPAEMFTSPSQLGAIMGDTLCDALNRERRERGTEHGPDDDPIFPACPGLDEATILVGSSNGKTFNRITVWYGPYVAGSYAEGEYALDFPMTAKMLEAVKPAYRAAFSAVP